MHAISGWKVRKLVSTPLQMPKKLLKNKPNIVNKVVTDSTPAKNRIVVITKMQAEIHKKASTHKAKAEGRGRLEAGTSHVKIKSQINQKCPKTLNSNLIWSNKSQFRLSRLIIKTTLLYQWHPWHRRPILFQTKKTVPIYMKVSGL